MPIAFRTSESTTMIRVNDVTITRMAGASESTVTSSRIWMADETVWGLFVSSTPWVVCGAVWPFVVVWAAHPVSASSATATTAITRSVRRRKTRLRMLRTVNAIAPVSSLFDWA